MFHCDSRFQQYTNAIRRVWDSRFTKTVGNWRSLWWWGVVVLFGFFLTLPLVAINYQRTTIFPYLQEVYCPVVRDCIPFFQERWPLPAWYWIRLTLAVLAFLSSSITQWAYRRRRWCLAWWSYLTYSFAFLYFLGTLMESALFISVSDAPILTALVGYSLPIIYTVWFLGALLPSMRRLWRGERLTFRPLPLKLQAGTGGAIALLGILGVALERMFGEAPHGNWGYFAVGVIFVLWLMYLATRDGPRLLFTLAPWRIVLEAEAAKKALHDSREFEEEKR